MTCCVPKAQGGLTAAFAGTPALRSHPSLARSNLADASNCAALLEQAVRFPISLRTHLLPPTRGQRKRIAETASRFRRSLEFGDVSVFNLLKALEQIAVKVLRQPVRLSGFFSLSAGRAGSVRAPLGSARGFYLGEPHICLICPALKFGKISEIKAAELINRTGE